VEEQTCVVTASNRSAADPRVRRWRELLTRYSDTFAALDHALHEQHGLRANEFEVLDRLADRAPARQRLQELAVVLHLSQSALSRVVARLEADGLVVRTMCTSDRRGVWVQLTDAGHAAHDAASRTHIEVLTEHL
jgi:DNA-binding MarR family transcriptional regulator